MIQNFYHFLNNIEFINNRNLYNIISITLYYYEVIISKENYI